MENFIFCAVFLLFLDEMFHANTFLLHSFSAGGFGKVVEYFGFLH